MRGSKSFFALGARALHFARAAVRGDNLEAHGSRFLSAVQTPSAPPEPNADCRCRHRCAGREG